MRRWLAATLCLAALAGCSRGLPEGVDGDLTGQWSPPPRAAAWQPLLGKCFDEVRTTIGPEDYAPIDCTEAHVAETFYVGELSGAAAGDKANQGDPSAARLAGYRQCARRADDFVNGSWRTGRLIVVPVLPDGPGWKGGSRWLRCDIAEEGDDGDPAPRSGSLDSAISDDPLIKLGCFDPTVEDEDVTVMKPVSCARAHHSEFAGLFTAPAGFTLDELTRGTTMDKGCLSTIARFAKVPNDSMMKYRTGWLGFPTGELAWKAGDHSVRCYLWLSRETLTGSYRNAGPKKLRVHYA